MIKEARAKVCMDHTLLLRFFFKAVSTQLVFKGMKKDAKVPKHMSNACFCPKENTASFR